VLFRDAIFATVHDMPSFVVGELLAIIVPPACVACRAPLPRAELRVCAACTRALPWLPARLCPRCGLPSHRRTGCPAASAAFTRAWAPLAHDGVARELVSALKFRAALPITTLMAAHIAANLPPDLRAATGTAGGSRDARVGGPAPSSPPYLRTSALAAPHSPHMSALEPVAIVAVPPQPARARRRGFDPAGALAAALAPRLGLPERPCLRRRDRERRQVGASRAQRRRSGRLTIELRVPPPARALLVDDVHTTGATLDACARALLAGGSREVVALTYTRTL
jgi:predicted amidophosphoribosyltransferase